MRLVRVLLLYFGMSLIARGEDFIDQVTLLGGQIITGKAGILTDEILPFQAKVGESQVMLRYQKKQIMKIVLGRPDEVKEWMRHPSPKLIADLIKIWEAQEGFIDVTGSDLGGIGIAIGESWLAGGKKSIKKRVVSILNEVIQKDWNEERRKLAVDLKKRVDDGEKTVRVESDLGVEENTLLREARTLKLEWEQSKQNNQGNQKVELKLRQELLLHQALDTYAKVWLGETSSSDCRLQARYEAALLADQSGRSIEARQWFGDLVRQSPNSALGKEAQQKLKTMDSIGKSS